MSSGAVVAHLRLALDSQLRFHLPAAVSVAAKTGELDSVVHEAALLEDAGAASSRRSARHRPPGPTRSRPGASPALNA